MKNDATATHDSPPRARVDLERLITVEQLAARGPLSAAGWRWALHRRRETGLDAAVVRVGRRLLLDLDAVERWLADQREGAAPAGAPRP